MKKILGVILVIWTAFSICSADGRQDFGVMLEHAGKGDVEAMCDLGAAYFNGKGTLKDPVQAKCWIKRAYDQGSLRAEKLWNKFELWQFPGKCKPFFDDEKRPKDKRRDQYQDPVTGMEFVFIPKGCFIMGCRPSLEKCRKDELPGHRVCVEGFWMGKYEVTQEQWRRVMGRNPSRFTGNGRNPVENVSFDDIQAFIRQLHLAGMTRVSLPTEAQWEYACRNGGKAVVFPWGDEPDRPDANCGTCRSEPYYGETAPVGSFFPNAIGLYDMAGNVKEWCEDRYDKKAYAEQERKNQNHGRKGASRVVRGGSFSDNTSWLRCSKRDKSIPGMRSDNLGFRLVLARER